MSPHADNSTGSLANQQEYQTNVNINNKHILLYMKDLLQMLHIQFPCQNVVSRTKGIFL